MQMALGDTRLFISSKETAKGQHQKFSFTTSERKMCLEHKTLYSLSPLPRDIRKTLCREGEGGVKTLSLPASRSLLREMCIIVPSKYSMGLI